MPFLILDGKQIQSNVLIILPLTGICYCSCSTVSLQGVDDSDVGVGYSGDGLPRHRAAAVGIRSDLSPGVLQPQVEQG